MNQADLIYDALLRAERRMEDARDKVVDPTERAFAMASLTTIALIREEIGRGLAAERI